MPDQQFEPELLKKNKVKSIVVWQHTGHGGVFESSKFSYDTLGRCIRNYIYKINYKTVWKYDHSGNVTEELDSTNKNIRSHHKFHYEYDKNGLLVRQYTSFLKDTCIECYHPPDRKFPADSCQDTCVTLTSNYLRDTSGNIQKVMLEYTLYKHHETIEFYYTYNADGKLTEMQQFKTWKFFYNKKGRLIRYEEYFNKGHLYQYTTCKYDRKGNLLQSTVHASDGTRLGKEVFTYSKDGLPQTWVLYGQTGIRFNRFFKYEFYSFH